MNSGKSLKGLVKAIFVLSFDKRKYHLFFALQQYSRSVALTRLVLRPV